MSTMHAEKTSSGPIGAPEGVYVASLQSARVVESLWPTDLSPTTPKVFCTLYFVVQQPQKYKGNRLITFVSIGGDVAVWRALHADIDWQKFDIELDATSAKYIGKRYGIRRSFKACNDTEVNTVIGPYKWGLKKYWKKKSEEVCAAIALAAPTKSQIRQARMPVRPFIVPGRRLIS